METLITNNIDIHPFYKVFDDIVCISLKERVDRRESAIMEGKHMGIPFRFYLAEKHPINGMIGCFMSHYNVIREAYNKGHNSIMILEDDFCPSPSYFNNKYLTDALNFINIRPQWEILQLGYVACTFDFLKSANPYPSIAKFMSLASHAYCISRAGMERFINHINIYYFKNIDLHIDLHIDILLIKLFRKHESYSVVPLLIDQKWCMGTDNINDTLFYKLLNMSKCTAERTKILYYITIIYIYRINILICIIFIVFIIFLIFIYVWWLYQNKNNTKTKITKLY